MFLRTDAVLVVSLLLSVISGDLAAIPSITSIAPLTGSSAGGTTVTILGTGFSTVNAVSFGHTSATSFMIVSDTEITATSPAHVPQVVSLLVSGSSGEDSAYYVYQGNWQVYVANSTTGTVSILDPGTNSVLDSLSVGNNPCYIVFTPDGRNALVTNASANSLTFINAVTQQTLTTVSTAGTFPNAMVINPDGSAVYVANNNNGVVSALEIATGTSLWTYTTSGNPSTLAITPDGTLLGITNTATDEVLFLNATTGNLHNQISLASSSSDCIVLDSSTTTAYVANTNNNSVSIISPYTGTSSITTLVGNNPTALTLTSDGSKLYVANTADGTVSVIDTASHTVTRTISVGVGPNNMMITGTQGYVTNSTSGTVSVIDTTTENSNTISSGIGSQPYAMGILPDGSKVYVANASSGSVSVIQTMDNTVVATPSVGTLPCSIAITPDQAPLALFSYQVVGSGELVTFDGSASVSPVGVISNYSWDFGDGATLETAAATTSHLYTAAGTYQVRLTVTNSAGTATEQIFNHSSSRKFNQTNPFVTQSETLSHNGGSSATTTQSLEISSGSLVPLPPSNLQGRSLKNKFLTNTDRINVLTWNRPQGGATVELYRIYRNSSLTDLAGSVAANSSLEFIDHHRKSHVVYAYYVVSVSPSGSVSSPARIKVKSK